ncbi:MAG: STAS domain-containing protein [Sedimentisphaerales bacterium]|nr:STAS domain-containing protein [Sedimentisphaerales bacterium]
MELQIRTLPLAPTVAGVSLEGSIGGTTYRLLDEEVGRLLTGPYKTLVLDMKGVDQVTSAGIGVIMKAKASAKNKGGDLAMRNVQPQVKRVFEIMSLVPALNVFEDRAELDDYLARVQQRIVDDQDES